MDSDRQTDSIPTEFVIPMKECAFLYKRLVKGKGRALFATKDIPKGTIIHIEGPTMAFKITPEKEYTWQFRWAYSILVKEMKSIIDIQELIGFLHPLSDRHRDVDFTMSILPHLENQTLPTLNESVVATYYTLDKRRFSHILTKLRLNCIGGNTSAGVYSCCCMLNHSCDPNASWVFPSKRELKQLGKDESLELIAVLSAIRDIKKGEEVTASYMTEFTEQKDTVTRKRMIRERYLFDCTCSRCVKIN